MARRGIHLVIKCYLKGVEKKTPSDHPILNIFVLQGSFSKNNLSH